MSLLVETLLIAALCFFAGLNTVTGTSLISRPIVLGTLTGLIMGDITQGIIMGGSLELFYVGAVSIGAYIPPDMVSGTILATAFAMKSGTGVETALALSYPIAVASQAIGSLGTPISLALVHRGDKLAAEGDVKGFQRNYWLTAFLTKLIFLPITPLAYYLGVDTVTAALNKLPEFISNGIGLSGGIIPALGFAMLAQMIMSKRLVVFFFLGFFMVQYFQMGTTGVAIFSIILAIILVSVEQKIKDNTVPNVGGDFDEF